jgi:hypothetical protein
MKNPGNPNNPYGPCPCGQANTKWKFHRAKGLCHEPVSVTPRAVQLVGLLAAMAEANEPDSYDSAPPGNRRRGR